MFTVVTSAAVIGLKAFRVDVEVDVSRGMRSFNLVGLPTSSVSEARTRVKSALLNTRYGFPSGRVVVNLAPAHIRKDGTAYDLPIALALLANQGLLPVDALCENMFVGELSLDGTVRPIRGALPIAMLAKKSGIRRLFIPYENAQSAAQVCGLDCYAVRHLGEIQQHFANEVCLAPIQSGAIEETTQYDQDLMEVNGQLEARRALEISAAGGHNLLLNGPPGCGKTMLARRLPTILPPMSMHERVEVACIASVADPHRAAFGMTGVGRPFRAPHHTVSDVALIGGGSMALPGEVSLAHYGVLYLDELPEFKRSALESLRQPLEDGQVVVSRSQVTAQYPAKVSLVASMNPCPCGYYGHPKRECSCSHRDIARYRRKLSGPLLDRFDLQVDLNPVPLQWLVGASEANESSALVRERVCDAQRRQRSRASELGPWRNARRSFDAIVSTGGGFSTSARSTLSQAVEKFDLSARGYTRIARVARSIADLEADDVVQDTHVAEALFYRVRAHERTMSV